MCFLVNLQIKPNHGFQQNWTEPMFKYPFPASLMSRMTWLVQSSHVWCSITREIPTFVLVLMITLCWWQNQHLLMNWFFDMFTMGILIREFQWDWLSNTKFFAYCHSYSWQVAYGQRCINMVSYTSFLVRLMSTMFSIEGFHEWHDCRSRY